MILNLKYSVVFVCGISFDSVKDDESNNSYAHSNRCTANAKLGEAWLVK